MNEPIEYDEAFVAIHKLSETKGIPAVVMIGYLLSLQKEIDSLIDTIEQWRENEEQEDE